jgi:hypothetical protein
MNIRTRSERFFWSQWLHKLCDCDFRKVDPIDLNMIRDISLALALHAEHALVKQTRRNANVKAPSRTRLRITEVRAASP